MGRAAPSPLVRVVVVNWNGGDATLACLQALDALAYPSLRVLVVDNASTDGSDELIRRARPDVELVQSGFNAGYAGGNNIGLRRALDEGAAYAWILNNDATPAADALAELVGCAESNPRLGALGSRALRPDGTQQRDIAFRTRAADWSVFGDDGAVLCNGCDVAATWHEAGILRGPSLLLRCEAVREVGLFDESYFHFFEEMDLVERLARQDWKLGMACRSVVVHRGGASLAYSTPQAVYYLYRNHMLFRRKLFGEHPLRVFFDAPGRRLRMLVPVRSILRGDLRRARAAWAALGDALRRRSGPRNLGSSHRREPRR